MGGVGAVFLAEQPLIDARVAIKILRPEVMAVPGAEERFIQEARAVARIGGPHLPRYYDFGRLPSGNPYAVLEYLEGETIDELVQRRGALPVDEVVPLLAQVAEALEETHASGIVHRDIKPENLFLVAGADGKPFVKVLDFGIAKLVSREASARLTQTGLMVGTPQYAPPQQLLGEDVGASADIYALGATAFEMLAGRSAFAGDTTQVVQAKLTRDAPRLSTLLPALPPALVELVARMLAREPERRPANMGEVREALAALGTQATALPVTTTSRSPWWARSSVLLLLALAVWAIGHRAPSPVVAPPTALPTALPIVLPIGRTVAPQPVPPAPRAPTPAAAPRRAAPSEPVVRHLVRKKPAAATSAPPPPPVTRAQPIIVNPF